MNITILGATGMVGSRLVAEARTRGHHVTAISRNSTDGVAVDVTDTEQLARALPGADAVILAVRPSPGLTTGILDVTALIDVPLLIIGGAGPLRVPDADTLVIDDPRYVGEAWRHIARASVTQLEECRTHPNTWWVYLSPPAGLEPGDRTGRYRRGTDTLLVNPDGTSRISAEDLAVAAVDEVERPGGDSRITVVEH